MAKVDFTILREQFDALTKQLYKITQEAQSANQSLQEFIATYDSFRRRFHPIIFWFITIFSKLRRR